MSKNNNQNNLTKMFLILAAATAINVARKPQPNTIIPRSLHLPTAVTQNVNHDDCQDATLDAEKLTLIQTKVAEILNQLEIGDLRNQPIEKQQAAAYKILTHIIAATTNLYDSKNADTSTLNSIYQNLSAGVNVNALTSESMVICLLYQQAGLDSQCVTIQKQLQHVNDVVLERNIVMVKFNDGNQTQTCYCDPIHTKFIGKNTKGQNDYNNVFMSEKTYFGQYYKDYQPVAEFNPADDLAKATAQTITPTIDYGKEF